MSKINNNNEAAEKVEVGEALTRTEKFLQTYKWDCFYCREQKNT